MAPTLRFVAFLLAAPALGSAFAQEAPKDLISLRDGRRVRAVEITEATSTNVHYKRRNEEADIATSLIAEIEWDGLPEEYSQARGALRTGDCTQASNLFLASAGKTPRAVLKAECEFLAAEALQRGAGKDKAAATEAARKLVAWIDANPDGMRLPDALMALGRAQVGAGQFAEAETTFKKLADDSIAHAWSPIWNARGKLGLAQAQTANGDFPNARSTYRSATSALLSLSEAERQGDEALQIQAEALVGTGDSLVREGKFDDALAYFRDDVGRRATNDAIRAAARAGEGEAMFLKAQSSGNGTNELRAAQVAFAEANLLDTVGGETTAKALYYSGLVLLALGPDRDGASVRQRAAEYFGSVVRQHSTTRWAALASAELKR